VQACILPVLTCIDLLLACILLLQACILSVLICIYLLHACILLLQACILPVLICIGLLQACILLLHACILPVLICIGLLQVCILLLQTCIDLLQTGTGTEPIVIIAMLIGTENITHCLIPGLYTIPAGIVRILLISYIFLLSIRVAIK